MQSILERSKNCHLIQMQPEIKLLLVVGRIMHTLQNVSVVLKMPCENCSGHVFNLLSVVFLFCI